MIEKKTGLIELHHFYGVVMITIAFSVVCFLPLLSSLSFSSSNKISFFCELGSFDLIIAADIGFLIFAFFLFCERKNEDFPFLLFVFDLISQMDKHFNSWVAIFSTFSCIGTNTFFSVSCWFFNSIYYGLSLPFFLSFLTLKIVQQTHKKRHFVEESFFGMMEKEGFICQVSFLLSFEKIVFFNSHHFLFFEIQELEGKEKWQDLQIDLYQFSRADKQPPMVKNENQK